MKTPYSHDYFPPAPVLIIGLAVPEQAPMIESQPALIDSIRLPGVEVVSDDWGSEIIIGRNALNKLRLLLDGPQQSTEIG